MTSLISAGARRPTYQTGPRARTSPLGADAADLAELAGLVLDDWQKDVLWDALAEDRPGHWAAFEVGVIVPRQNGKGAILEALELHALFRQPGCRLILHSAHEFKTAKEAFRRIVSLIDANPKLSKRARVRYTTGEEGIELDDGSRLKFVARSSGSGRGFSGDLVILDEAYNLSDDMLSALLPTMSARPNPQLWYTSSAPLPRLESEVLRRLCKRGRAGTSGRLAYSEWCIPEGMSADDPEAAPAANPGFGHRISDEFCGAERAALGPEGYARERLGVWSELEGTDRVISAAAWEACGDETSSPTGGVSFAADMSPDRHVSIAVAGDSHRGGTHVEVIEQRRGTGGLADRLRQLQATHGGRVAVAVGSPLWSIERELVDAGVDLVEVSTVEHAQACEQFKGAVEDRSVRHRASPEVEAALAGAEKRFTGDMWLWSRKNSTVDISALVAVTLAKWAFENAAPADATASVW